MSARLADLDAVGAADRPAEPTAQKRRQDPTHPIFIASGGLRAKAEVTQEGGIDRHS
jgi:hypothetical protein